MLLAIDIGNSSISVGVFELSNQDTRLVSNFKITAKDLSSDEFAILIKDFLLRDSIYPYDATIADARSIINCAAISSVVPKLTNTLVRAARQICGSEPFVVGEGIRTGFGIHVKNPEQLGTDIVCNVAAAIADFTAPIVILDMGTATTITLIDKNLTIQGTVISPGLEVSLSALCDSAAQISDIAFDKDFSLIGKDTKSAVCSGVINGNAFMIDGFVRNIREQYLDKEKGEKLSLVATGGLSQAILPFLRNKFEFVDALTLQGIAKLYLKNHKNV